MQTIWMRAGNECRLTVAEISGSVESHVIDYIIWSREVYVGNVKFCCDSHLWGIKLCPYIVVTQEYLTTIWAKFQQFAPHTAPEKTDV